MSKQRILMVAAVCFVLLGTVAAGRGRRSEPKPDSVVTCISFNIFFVDGISLPDSIDVSECTPGGNISRCSPCILSLENQGCDVLDFDLLNEHDRIYQSAFVLSCE